MERFFTTVTALLLFALWSNVFAQVKPAQIFSDNMVLQREIKIPVWGTAAPGEKISVSFEGQIVSGITDSIGKWKIYLPALKSGGPFCLTITGVSDSIVFNNVLVGDVWFASGQSNMEHPVQGWEWIPHSAVENYKDELQDTDYPGIRLFNVPKFPSPVEQEDLISGEWQTANAKSVAGFSSIGWFFAKKLNADLNIPIGIIHASWGGTPIRTWLDRQTLELFRDSIDLPLLPENFNTKEWEKTALSSIESNRVHRDEISYPPQELTEKITNTNYDDSDWEKINFPFTNNKNVVWIRKKIIIPSVNRNLSLQLSLGFLNRQSHIFFNDKELGYFQYPKPVKTTVPSDLIKQGENVLTIRLAQPFGPFQIFGEKEAFYLASSNNSFYKNLAEDWKINSELEQVNSAGESFQNNPAFLFNGMVAPVIPFGIKGFIWSQGESDAGRPFLYKTMFEQLILSWRQQWGKNTLPFLFIQASNIELTHRFEIFDDSQTLLRVAQQQALALPNTGMVVSVDIGDPYDVHPKNKKQFAERLALQAEEKVYGKKIVSDGPLAESFIVKDNTIVVKYKSENGLKVTSEKNISGFEIAGADEKFYPAKIKLNGLEVTISSPNVKNPVTARYAWKNNPECTLYTIDGLPAAPFCTIFLEKNNNFK